MRGDRPGTDPPYPSSMPWSLPLGICLHQRMPAFHMNWLCSPNLTQLKLIQNIWKFWIGKNLNNPLIWMNLVSGALVFTSSLQNNSTLTGFVYWDSRKDSFCRKHCCLKINCELINQASHCIYEDTESLGNLSSQVQFSYVTLSMCCVQDLSEQKLPNWKNYREPRKGLPTTFWFTWKGEWRKPSDWLYVTCLIHFRNGYLKSVASTIDSWFMANAG